MKLKILEQHFVVCKVNDLSEVNLNDAFCFVGKTDEELSVVCSEAEMPAHVIESEKGWRGFRIEGVLDFSLVGILAKLSDVLARAEVGIFAISTFNTDYILVRETQLHAAITALEAVGYEFV